MTYLMQYKNLIKVLGFTPKENTSDIFFKKYADGSVIELDFDKKLIDYGKKIKAESKTTQNFSQAENWVILECVNRLLEKGYKPENITLEKTYPSGHGHSGRLDILIENQGRAFLMIECKTWGVEFNKEQKNIEKNGGQLFTYFQNDTNAQYLMLYASHLLEAGDVDYKCEIIKIEEHYRGAGNVEDVYDRWNKITNQNGIFDDWVKAYHFENKLLIKSELKPLKESDSGFIFHGFLSILRKHSVSDKPNAFNKIFNLFLAKIYDEKKKKHDVLDFQWKESEDDHVSFQVRLINLYQQGMFEFLRKEVEGIRDADFSYKTPEELKERKKKWLKFNNVLMIKEVVDDESFEDNARVLKEVVELLEKYQVRYPRKQQHLSDFFERLLTTGLKQESGQFFTPPPIARFIVKSIPITQFITKELDNPTPSLPAVIDYAAGSGHFVTEIMEEYQNVIDKLDTIDLYPDVQTQVEVWQKRKYDWAGKYIYGVEKDYRLVKVAKVGCYFYGDGLAQIIHGDGLDSFSDSKSYVGLLKQKIPSRDLGKFSFVVSNPPYSVSTFKGDFKNTNPKKDFELHNYLTDKSSEIECLFVERTKQLLKEGGVAAIILPSSILSNTGIYTKTREIILQNFDIVAIAELGSNTFMATGTNTVTLFLRRRNNYDSINLRKSVGKFFVNLQDVTLNGIENPVSKYVAHTWEGISFDDYKTLLQKKPNEAIQQHEIYQEYHKKIKAKNEQEKWNEILKLEEEKLFYFILAYPQKVVLVNSGQKKEEKQFLGYEFSHRRGSEGIHPIQRGKSIDECTSLFDADVFNNPEKASTYIYKAFNGDFDFPINESLRKNISRACLVDMLTFDRVDFEKNISLSAQKKVKIESRWEVVKIGQIANTQYGFTDKAIDKGEIRYLRITDLNDDGSIKLENEAKFINPDEETKKQFQLNNNDIVIARSGSVGKSAIFKVDKYQEMIFASYLIRLIANEDKVLPQYLFNFTKTEMYWNQVEVNSIAVTQPNLNAEKIKDFDIPLPPKEIQEKIVSEIEVLEQKEKTAIESIEVLRNQAISVLDTSNGTLVKLQEITTKIGSGATPRGGESAYKQDGISLIRSQNIYDKGMIRKGLAFIDDAQAEKLNNVTVEPNDVLFNITGASVARCCLLDSSYLPARVNQHVAIIRANEKVSSKYLQQILVSSKIKSELLEIAESSSTREAITKSQLEDFKIPLPPLPEQQKVVSEIEKIEAQITEFEKEISTIPQQKEKILKKYLE